MHSLRATHPEGFNMEDIKIGNGSISIWGIIAAVGGLLAFIGLFLTVAKTTTDLGWLGTSTTNISGLDLLSNKMDGEEVDSYSFYRFMPLLFALAGLATLVLSILPIFGVSNSGIKIAAMVCGILTLVFGILMLVGCASYNLYADDLKDAAKLVEVKTSAQIGAYFGLIGGILACAGACLDKFGVKI